MITSAEFTQITENLIAIIGAFGIWKGTGAGYKYIKERLSIKDLRAENGSPYLSSMQHQKVCIEQNVGVHVLIRAENEILKKEIHELKKDIKDDIAALRTDITNRLSLKANL